MHNNIRQVLMAILACCAVLLPLSAQQRYKPLHLVLERPHQLRDLIVALQMRNWLVTFEEAPALSPRELKTTLTPTGLSVLVNRTVPLIFDIGAEDLSITSSDARAAVLQRLLSSYVKAGYTDSYRVINQGRCLHIIPTMTEGESGKPEAVESALDVTVSFQEQRFDTLYGLVDEVLNQVSQTRGVPVVLGNVPNNLFRQTPVVESANNESAREVLARAFAEINGPRLASGLEPVGLPWTLSYDPNDRQYWFSVNLVHIDISGSRKPNSASIQNSNSGVSGGIPNAIRKVQ